MKLFFSLAALLPAADAAGVGNFFTYYKDGGLGPERWQFLTIDDNQCGGMEGATGFGQSPVTIDNTVRATEGSACDTNKRGYQFDAGTCTWDQLKFSISNNGVKVEPKADAGCSFGSMNIPHTPNKFNALQFHIHTYSEHQIEQHPLSIDKSGYFPAELHVVHAESTGESFAVFGTMMSVGETPHPDFEWFLKGWEKVATEVANTCPTVEGEEANTIVQVKTQCMKTDQVPAASTVAEIMFPNEAPDLYRGLPTFEENQLGFFTYKGGLTTPACTEIVNWNLLDQPMEISQGQMERLEYLIHCFVEQDTTTDADGNVLSVDACRHATVASESGSTSRPPQPLLGRQVLHRCYNGPNLDIDDVGVLPAPGANFEKPARTMENPNTVSDPKCAGSMRVGCSDDKRYDPRESPNLKANSDNWYDVEGYWVGTKSVYDATGGVLLETFASEVFKNTLPYPQDEVFMFLNRTVVETRAYETLIQVYKPADDDLFCTYAVPDKSSNVLGNGVCGRNGYSTFGQKFGTATHEKDGMAMLFHGSGLYSGATMGKTLPIDEDTMYSAISNEEFEYTETYAFSNDQKTRVTGAGQFFIKSDVLPYSKNPLAESFTFEMNQVSKEVYENLLNAAFNKQNVLAEDRVAVVMESDCLDEKDCPTEADFRLVDPKFTETQYVDDSQLKTGWVFFFIILAVGALCLCFWYWHHKRIQRQANRYKHQFARRVAETINVDGTHEKLKAEDLEREFEKIDTLGNGHVTKEELRAFMGERINDKDFDVMFAAIDLDHSGTIEFSEFVAFMAQIGAIYDEEELDVAKQDEPASEPLPKPEEEGA